MLRIPRNSLNAKYSRKMAIDLTTREMHLVLETEAFEPTEVKLDETTQASDHSVTQGTILPAGN